jgi:hypothetical protein
MNIEIPDDKLETYITALSSARLEISVAIERGNVSKKLAATMRRERDALNELEMLLWTAKADLEQEDVPLTLNHEVIGHGKVHMTKEGIFGEFTINPDKQEQFNTARGFGVNTSLSIFGKDIYTD